LLSDESLEFKLLLSTWGSLSVEAFLDLLSNKFPYPLELLPD